jgi:hypothetical protein
VSLVSHFSETHGGQIQKDRPLKSCQKDRPLKSCKRTVPLNLPLNLDKDIVQLQNTGVLNIFGNR